LEGGAVFAEANDEHGELFVEGHEEADLFEAGAIGDGEFEGCVFGGGCGGGIGGKLGVTAKGGSMLGSDLFRWGMFHSSLSVHGLRRVLRRVLLKNAIWQERSHM
jgi:hypothetical protein